MNILLIDDDDSIRQYCTIILDNVFIDAKIREVSSGNEAIELLSESHNYDLIVCDYDMENGTGGDVYKYITRASISIPYLLHTTKDVDELDEFESFKNIDYNLYLQKPSKPKEFKELLKSCSFLSEFTQAKEPDYHKIRISYFWRFNKCLCDIYVRLSDNKFVKIINRNDEYSKEIIDKYIRKKQQFLYITKEDQESFSVTVAQTPFLEFVGAMKDKETSLKTTHAIIHDLVSTAGITNSAVSLAEECVEKTISHVNQNKILGQLLFKLRNRRDYIYDHSYMISCICASICRELDWTNKNTVEKLCMAALFHDIALEDPDIAMIFDLDNDDFIRFDQKELEVYQNHPKRVAELIHKSNKFLPDVDNIVLNHHEKMDGTGFPNKADAKKFSPLLCIFNIAHDYVTQLYKVEFDYNSHTRIIEYLEKKYSHGNFLKVITAFKKSFKEI